MKVTDISVEKQVLASGTLLVCTVTYDDGHQSVAHFPWNNTHGKWASSADEREPSEIVAIMRSFADAIECYAQQHEVA